MLTFRNYELVYKQCRFSVSLEINRLVPLDWHSHTAAPGVCWGVAASFTRARGLEVTSSPTTPYCSPTLRPTVSSPLASKGCSLLLCLHFWCHLASVGIWVSSRWSWVCVGTLWKRIPPSGYKGGSNPFLHGAWGHSSTLANQSENESIPRLKGWPLHEEQPPIQKSAP